jgi:hypothetical protein
MLAGTVIIPRWYARTAGSLLREISFKKEASYRRRPIYSLAHSDVTYRRPPLSSGELASPTPCCYMPKQVAPNPHVFTGATSPLWWYVRSIGSKEVAQ